MALFVYRYRLKTPVLETQLEVEVGVPITITAHAGGGIVDIECDDSRAQDLTDAMDGRGYEFVEGSPATTAAVRFRSDNDLNKAILADYDSSNVEQSTSSTTAQDAGMSVEASADGDYIVFYEAVVATRNNNSVMVISLSAANTLTELTASVRPKAGSYQCSNVVMQTYTGLSAGDVITALFRKDSGSQSVYVYNRSMFLMRID